MRTYLINLIALICIACAIKIDAEGFLAGTLVKTPDGYAPIEELVKNDEVICCNFSEGFVVKPITKIHKKLVNRYIKLFFDDEIICVAHDQRFYLPLERIWINAEDITGEDCFLKNNHEYFSFDSIVVVEEEAEVYCLTVPPYNNFSISLYDITVHNFTLGIEFIIEYVFEEGIKFGAGAAIGAAALCVGAKMMGESSNEEYQCEFRVSPNDNLYTDGDTYYRYESYEDTTCFAEKAPGKPTEKDGFFPPKKWNGRKVKHEKSDRYGWPDKNGAIWLPTGETPLAYRGPHWDVQLPNGGYINVMPGGKIC